MGHACWCVRYEYFAILVKALWLLDSGLLSTRQFGTTDMYWFHNNKTLGKS